MDVLRKVLQRDVLFGGLLAGIGAVSFLGGAKFTPVVLWCLAALYFGRAWGRLRAQDPEEWQRREL